MTAEVVHDEVNRFGCRECQRFLRLLGKKLDSKSDSIGARQVEYAEKGGVWPITESIAYT